VRGWRLDAGPARADELWTALLAAGATPLGRIAYDSVRVEQCTAEPGVDVDENVYPQEARLERAFSLDKGCYIGQEVVAKIDTYGGLNKRMVALRVSHDNPVARGTRLFKNDEGEWRDLGIVTSWAYSFALDTGLVLAYVKRRHQEVGTTFRLTDPNSATGEATIVESPVQPPTA
jgi:folate-binding protein YgfZ